MAGLDSVEATGTPPPGGFGGVSWSERAGIYRAPPQYDFLCGFGGVMQFACVRCGVRLDAGSVAAQRCRHCGRIFLDPLRGIRRLIKRARAGFAEST